MIMQANLPSVQLFIEMLSARSDNCSKDVTEKYRLLIYFFLYENLCEFNKTLCLSKMVMNIIPPGDRLETVFRYSDIFLFFNMKPLVALIHK